VWYSALASARTSKNTFSTPGDSSSARRPAYASHQ
jgi:hypothetical protein